jgi:ABC-2 type transport system ATP-binding protein
MKQAIAIEGLSKTFPGKKHQQILALDDLNLSVMRGEVFGFLGPNGAGKSTTIKTLVGQIKPTSGSARIFNQSILSRQAREKVGYLPENPSFYDFLTAREYLDLVGRCFRMSASDIQQESDRVLRLLDLDRAADRPMRGFSKGMVQRLGLAQALLHDPDLFILDEPMSGLDPVGRVLVKQLMQELRDRGKTIFFSTHVIADVEAVCDRVGIIAGGRLRFVQSVDQVLRAGIEGYLVQVSDCPATALDGFKVVDRGGRCLEVSVPRERYQEFTERLFARGGKVELVETQRRNLEALFMEIIGRES